MKKLVLFKLFLILFFLNSCTTVQTKIDQKTKEESDRLSIYIGKDIEETFIDFGLSFSDGLNEQGFREVTFQKTKLGVKCNRTFTVDNANMVTGFKSNCGGF